jgi:glycogen debranching enzyme
MGTVAGLNTRRYHALLIASLKPPTERYVLLSRFEEEAVIGDRTFALYACQYPGKLVDDGSRYLEDFSDQPCATWSYNLDGVKLKRQVYLVPGRQAVVVRYRSDNVLTLRIRPFLAYRDYHSLRHADSSAYAGLPQLEFRTLYSEAALAADPKWYYNIEYLTELERGLDFREDQFTPGVLTLDLRAGAWAPICASIDHTDATDPPAVKRDPFIVHRADGKPTIIAGYPWFTDWGRDTMISLPGLLIAPGCLDDARQIIEGFLQSRNQGIIPNRFPDVGETPEYNTVDATLWMFQAVRAWLQAGGDIALLRDVFYPAAKEIIDWHRRGTWYNIAVDARDSLLSVGPSLTWMDTRYTPRVGKPVEINALWHGALCLMADWGKSMADPDAENYRTEAARVRDSFRASFWNPERECLYDVLTPAGPDARLRPNQIFAVSLPFDLLEAAQQQAVVRIVERELLTSVGLRTLERSDPDFKPRYQGSTAERDAAYHQGTVWPWLLGPFIDGYLVAFGKTPQNLAYCRDLVAKLEAEAAQAGCIGSIAEIYDAEGPRYPRGCPAQAWSVAEIARVKAGLLK